MRLLYLLIFFIPILGILHEVNNSYLVPKINVQTLKIPRTMSSEFRRDSIRIAVLGDMHVKQTEIDYAELSSLIETVIDVTPDVVLLLGDYTASRGSILNIDAHRSEIADRLSLLTSLPVAAVLGNYETNSGIRQWQDALLGAGITVLQNEISKLSVKGQDVCIRGLGDVFTNQFEFVEFPKECNELTRITITHDPAGAFEEEVKGIIFAAHTHCGQLRLPVFGALWMPTAAPREATCGSYQDSARFLWVTSGVGTSILPIRLGAQAEWDLLTLTVGGGETPDDIKVMFADDT